MPLVRLLHRQRLNRAQYMELLQTRDSIDRERLFASSRKACEEIYGKEVYLRGLIEFTNICKNDCYYCGLRAGNNKAERYRLTEDEILSCCEKGYALGFRSFVLQGGEDPYFTDERLISVVRALCSRHPDCAVTLSVGERSRESYERLYQAGARRYLLRHESADEAHYRYLHPPAMSLVRRKRCLRDLKDIGYQVGCGFMVGSPGQTAECIAEDLLFIQDLQPHMVGVGPFLPHRDTPFASKAPGLMELTLFLLAVIRLMLPAVLLPATTALETLHPEGRELGILAGANVVMPNLSPASAREKYQLYDGKPCNGGEPAESKEHLRRRLEAIGYTISNTRGDHAAFATHKGG